MDRERLDAWLRSGHRTWRWRHDDDYARYEAVETRDDGLSFFAHSHVPGEDGIYRREDQSFEDFDANGPLWAMPEGAERELRAWLAKRRG